MLNHNTARELQSKLHQEGGSFTGTLEEAYLWSKEASYRRMRLDISPQELLLREGIQYIYMGQDTQGHDVYRLEYVGLTKVYDSHKMLNQTLWTRFTRALISLASRIPNA